MAAHRGLSLALHNGSHSPSSSQSHNRWKARTHLEPSTEARRELVDANNIVYFINQAK
jgi:hypothetical protein